LKSSNLHVISPVDGQRYVERAYTTPQEIDNVLNLAIKAHQHWRHTPIEERAKYCQAAVAALRNTQDRICDELSWQMGRPRHFIPGEINGFCERADVMIESAACKLAPIRIDEKVGVTRFIQRQPHGVVLSIVPWNYPYLTAVNTIIPAIMAGNVVILKPSAQTPITAERLSDAFNTAGLPSGIFQYVYLDHEKTMNLIQSPKVHYVSFTGSVEGGLAVQHAAADRLIDIGLELGGKDPAYVLADADIAHTVENLVDGAYFNSGQSCCGIERIYVHDTVYENFVDAFVQQVRQYKLGNPLDPETTLGPMAHLKTAEVVRKQINDALQRGAKTCIDTKAFPAAKDDTSYLAPQVMINVDHDMSVMREENFGPVVGIMKVTSDEEAIRLMNDSDYGLTASLWTSDEQRALTLGQQIDTGTCFMNRCDYLDPALAWTGVKSSGRGCTLSELGYEKLTRPKSFHFRVKL